MICRLCLKTINGQTSITIFAEFSGDGESELAKMIAKYFHLEVTQQDAVSNAICQECNNHLTAFHKYCEFVEKQQASLDNKFLLVEFDEQLITPNQVSATELQESMDVQLKCEPEEEFIADTLAMRNDKDNTSVSSHSSEPSRDLKKNTTSAQFSAIVGFMKANEGIARGMFSAPEYKTRTNILWDSLTEKLNSLGPPCKTTDGWKKVWKDFKYQTKKKMRDPKRLVGMSPLEEKLIDILDFKESGVTFKNVQKSIITFKSSIAATSSAELVKPQTTADTTPEPKMLEEDNKEERKEAFEVRPETANVTVPNDGLETKAEKKLLQMQDQPGKDSCYKKTTKLLKRQNKLLKEQNKKLREQTEYLFNLISLNREIKAKKLMLMNKEVELRERKYAETRRNNIERTKYDLEKLRLKKLELKQMRTKLMI